MITLEKRVAKVLAKHVPEWHTEYGIPCFDEFDSPEASYYRCAECHQRLYAINDNMCRIMRELKGYDD